MDGVALDNDCGIRVLRESGLEGLYLREGLAVVKRNGEGEGRSDAGDADGVIDEENSSAVVGVEVDTAVVVRQVGRICAAPGLAAVIGIASVDFADLCSCEHVNRAVLRFPKRGLDHRGLEEAEEGRINFGSSVPGLAVVGRYVNEASVFAAELGRAGSEYSAVLESDGLVLDGTSAAAVVAGDKLSGSCPVLAVGRDGIVGLPIFGVLADLEIEG